MEKKHKLIIKLIQKLRHIEQQINLVKKQL